VKSGILKLKSENKEEEEQDNGVVNKGLRIVTVWTTCLL